ncbi:MAG: 3-hydroxyacyl-ACP dehydratase FabZ [Nitrospinota bacterium]
MYNIEDIQKLIPHRYPFLLVDKITGLEKHSEITGLKNVTMNEPFFGGHFPDHPIMPGVLIIESMAQLAACLAALSVETQSKPPIPMFTGIKRAKFRKPVTPGDQLIINVRVLQARRANWRFSGVAKVGEKVAAESEFQAVLKE